MTSLVEFLTNKRAPALGAAMNHGLWEFVDRNSQVTDVAVRQIRMIRDGVFHLDKAWAKTKRRIAATDSDRDSDSDLVAEETTSEGEEAGEEERSSQEEE